MIEEIITWLNGSRDYAEGAELYRKFGNDKTLIDVFSEAYSPYKQKRLESALSDLADTQDFEVKEKKKALRNATTPEKSWPVSEDSVLVSLRSEWKEKYARMCFLCDTIYDQAEKGKTDLAAKRKAGEMALEILDLDDACDDIYVRRDFYLKHGRLPEEKPIYSIPEDPKQYRTAYNNSKVYISRFKKKLEENPKDFKVAAKLKMWMDTNSELKKLLNIED